MIGKAVQSTVKSRLKPKILKEVWNVLKHWYKFQRKAFQLKAWKMKYIFHDFQLIGLILLMQNKEKALEIHRYYSKHHPENIKEVYDFEQMVIDWEVTDSARETLKKYPKFESKMTPILERILYQ